jgi:hypothetical protein
MVAGAAFLCSGLVFLLPTKSKRSIEEDREQVDRAHDTENLLCPFGASVINSLETQSVAEQPMPASRSRKFAPTQA